MKRLLLALSLAMAMLAVRLDAAVLGGDGYQHPGDSPCSHFCDSSCAAAIHANEMSFTPPACANHTPSGGGYITGGVDCKNDYVGPSQNSLQCVNGTCTITGKLKCVVYQGGQVIAVKFPQYTLICGPHGSDIPKVTVKQDEALCIYTDGSETSTVCTDTGEAVTEVWL